jgi:hypothetical protein
MSQQALFQISHPTVRIYQIAVFVFGDCVDGEVASCQILFQRHARIGVKGKAVIAAPGFALGARQRIFLVGARVQEDREILADWFVAQFKHVFRTCADHHVIVIDHRAFQQFVADGAAHQISAHRHSLALSGGDRRFAPYPGAAVSAVPG